jgi:hypothetical protein
MGFAEESEDDICPEAMNGIGPFPVFPDVEHDVAGHILEGGKGDAVCDDHFFLAGRGKLGQVDEGITSLGLLTSISYKIDQISLLILSLSLIYTF